MSTPDTWNLVGLVLSSMAATLLVIAAPIPQRMCYFKDEEQGRIEQEKDKRTRIAYRIGLWLLVVGFVCQLVAQVMR